MGYQIRTEDNTGTDGPQDKAMSFEQQFAGYISTSENGW